VVKKNIVKLSEYRKKKNRGMKNGHGTGFAMSPLWTAAGLFALAVAVVFVYFLITGGRP